MNVRITPTSKEQQTVLLVSGRLQSADISELDKEVCSVNGALVLDLSELLSADSVGIARLRELSAAGAELVGTSHYMQLLLNNEGK